MDGSYFIARKLVHIEHLAVLIMDKFDHKGKSIKLIKINAQVTHREAGERARADHPG